MCKKNEDLKYDEKMCELRYKQNGAQLDLYFKALEKVQKSYFKNEDDRALTFLVHFIKYYLKHKNSRWKIKRDLLSSSNLNEYEKELNFIVYVLPSDCLDYFFKIFKELHNSVIKGEKNGNQ